MTSVCKRCGAAIVWVRTPGGKQLPCDAGLHPYWAQKGGKGRVVTPNGEVLACTWHGSGAASGLGYVPHFATCGRGREPEERAEQMSMY